MSAPTLQIETITRHDGAKMDVIRDVEKVEKMAEELAALRAERDEALVKLGFADELRDEAVRLRDERDALRAENARQAAAIAAKDAALREADSELRTAGYACGSVIRSVVISALAPDIGPGRLRLFALKLNPSFRNRLK